LHCFKETATLDALELVYEFQNILGLPFNDILHAHIWYSYGGDPAHNIKLQLWNYNLSQWDYVTNAVRDFGYTAGSLNPLTFNWGNGQVLDPITDYLDNGNMMMKIVHISLGIIYHQFCLDFIELDIGFQSSSSSSSSSLSLSSSSLSSSSGVSVVSLSSSSSSGEFSSSSLSSSSVSSSSSSNSSSSSSKSSSSSSISSSSFFSSKSSSSISLP
jgi:hypothetical protein